MSQRVSADDFAVESSIPGTPAFIMMQNKQIERIINHEITIESLIAQVIRQQIEENREQRINLASLDALRAKLENDLIQAEERYIKNQVEKTQQDIQANIQNIPAEKVIAYLNHVIDSLTEEKDRLDKEMEPYKQEVQKHRAAVKAVDDIVDNAYDQEAQDDARRRYEADLRNQGVNDESVIADKWKQFNNRGKAAHVDLAGVKRLLKDIPVNPHILMLSTLLKKTQAVYQNPEKAMQVNPFSTFGDKLYSKSQEVGKAVQAVDTTYVPVAEHAETLQSMQFSSNTISAMLDKAYATLAKYEKTHGKGHDEDDNESDWYDTDTPRNMS